MSSVNVNPESAEARQIDRANFNRAIGAIQNLSRLHFDKNHFQISWHGPIPIIRLRRGALGTTLSLPFTVTQATATTVNVSAGHCYVAGVQRTISASTGLDCSAGTSTTGYVYFTLDLAATTTGSIAYSATLPASDDDEEKIILAHISKNAGGKISGVSQRWLGDFYTLRYS